MVRSAEFNFNDLVSDFESQSDTPGDLSRQVQGLQRPVLVETNQSGEIKSNDLLPSSTNGGVKPEANVSLDAVHRLVESYNVLDPRRGIPLPSLTILQEVEAGMHKDAAMQVESGKTLEEETKRQSVQELSLFWNTLKDEVVRNDSMSQFQDGRGNARLDVNLEGREARLDASLRADRPENVASLNLLFASLKFVSPEEFPEVMKTAFADLKLDADVFNVMKQSEILEDPMMQKAVYLAAFEKQLHEWGVRYFDVAWEAAQAIDTTPMTREQARANIDEQLKKIREARSLQGANTDPAGSVPAASIASTPPYSPKPDDVQGEQRLAELASKVFSRNDLLWNLSRAKYPVHNNLEW
ncbi:MAG: hypothetical protein IAF58_21440 [Leptolyngbya sp.]|nr:hypothetical protein [Candidatus Melainabacteria bacterium]